MSVPAMSRNSSAQGASWKVHHGWVTACSRFAFTSCFARFTPSPCTGLPRTRPGTPRGGAGVMLLVPEPCRVPPWCWAPGKDRGKGKAQGQSSADSGAGVKAKPKASERVCGCLTQQIEALQACRLEKPHKYFNSGRMKGKQANIGLGLWGVAVIISSETQSCRWDVAAAQGDVAAARGRAEAGRAWALRRHGAEHPRHGAAGLGEAAAEQPWLKRLFIA